MQWIFHGITESQVLSLYIAGKSPCHYYSCIFVKSNSICRYFYYSSVLLLLLLLVSVLFFSVTFVNCKLPTNISVVIIREAFIPSLFIA